MLSKSLVKQKYIDYINMVIKSNRISHAYLIEIDDYDNDFIYVINFVKMILCNISYDDVFVCDDKIISLIDNGNFSDISIVEPDGNWIKKNQLLELQKEYSNKSLFGLKRIYIIKYAEKMNLSSANTILKFLEEPDDDIIAFILTENRYLVLDTILSRCQVLTLREDSFCNSIDNNIIFLLNYIVNPREFFIKYNFCVSNCIVDKNIAKEYFIRIEDILVNYLNYIYCDYLNFNDEYLNILRENNDNYILFCLSLIEKYLPKLDFNVNYKMWLDSFFAELIDGGL